MVKVKNKLSGIITELDDEHYKVLQDLDLASNFDVITPAPTPPEIKAKHETKKASKKADPGDSGQAPPGI